MFGSPCRCGVNGGKHLFKDCPKAKEKKDKEQAAAAAEASKAKLASDGADLRAALQALLPVILSSIVRHAGRSRRSSARVASRAGLHGDARHGGRGRIGALGGRHASDLLQRCDF